MSPLSPSTTRPGVCAKVSQIDGVRPSSATAPSIWYAAVAAPHRKPGGKASDVAVLSWAMDVTGSSLHGAGDDPADDLAAEQHEHHEHRQGPDEGPRHDHSGVRHAAAAEVVERDLDGRVGRVEGDDRPEVVVPGGHEREH